MYKFILLLLLCLLFCTKPKYCQQIPASFFINMAEWMLPGKNITCYLPILLSFFYCGECGRSGSCLCLNKSEGFMSCLLALLADLSRQPKYLEKMQKTNREAHSSTLLGLAADSSNLFTERPILSYIYLGYFVCLCVIVCVCVCHNCGTHCYSNLIIKLTEEARWMDWRWRY